MQKQEDSELSFSDVEQQVIEPSPEIPANDPEPIPESQPQDSGLNKRQKQTNEVLYIIFKHYRKHIEDIAKKYQCIVKISMSSYIISNSNSAQKQEFGKCYKEIFDFVKSINCEKVGDLGTQNTAAHLSDKLRYSYSPYFTNLLRSKDINLIVFHNDIYAFSRKIPKQAIKKEILAFTKNKCIFPVRYNKVPKPNSKLSYPEYYKEINCYLQKVFLFYFDFLKERDVIAELNTNKTFIYLIGQRQKYLMEAKLTMKNVIESMVCLIIKNTVVDQKKLIKFLQTASAYPIHYGKLSEKRFIIISKDNILKQLISKSMNFFKYMGINLSGSEDQVEPNIGIFLIRSPTFKTKIEKIRDVCKLKGYDLFDNGNVYYINQVFYHQGMEDKNIIKFLLGNIMLVLQENKQKFETMNRLAKEQKQTKNEPANNLKYIPKGGRVQEQNLSKIMKRDVLTQKLQMKKQHMIAFNIIQTKEQMQYWKLKENGEEGDQVKEYELKPGKYLRGFKKVGEDKTVAIIFQEIITII